MAVCHCFEAAFLVFLFISHSPQYCCLHMFLLPSLVPDCFLPVLGHERDIFRWRTLFFLLDVFISNVVDKTIITVFFKRFKYVHNIPWCSNQVVPKDFFIQFCVTSAQENLRGVIDLIIHNTINHGHDHLIPRPNEMKPFWLTVHFSILIYYIILLVDALWGPPCIKG